MIRSEDGSLAALLGASPGASVAVAVMTGLIQASFGVQIPQFEARMQALIPVFGKRLADDPQAVREARARAASVLGIVQ